MANNIDITPGSGKTVATDEVNDGAGARHFQIYKLGWGAAGAANQASATNPLPVNPVPQTSGGWTPYYRTSAATTNGVNVKASAGQLGGFVVTNSNTSARYLRFYNTAGTPTVGSTATVAGCMIPGSGGVTFPAGAFGADFSSGIAISFTTGAADTDTGAVAADEIKLTLFYK